MIGLDTNILLRATLNDDPVQSPAAHRLLRRLDGELGGFVNIPVLMEFFWVLRSRYRLPRTKLAETMRALIEIEHIEVEDLEVVGKALASYDRGGADFADMVVALRNEGFGVERTYTFDQAAARAIPAMELLA